ncbi:MAG: tRNA (adenosine(37)-N6)-dimethylallyltransferase MiaA [Bacteroidetes bacterium]|nr:tRNA (adenosine(37)-N6)-dimethylallyltransferase MiaA [Bacteroidota bacterium]
MVIAGPTAVGKTDLSISLAKHYKADIINADSRQFYKELNIGVAKPSLDQLNTVKHHLINNKTINDLYGAGHFEKDAITLITELFKKHQLLIVCGGSGLYLNALLYGIDDFEEVPIEVRNNLNTVFLEKGILHIQEMLLKHDPIYYNSIDINNPQRIIRALEICIYTGKPYSSLLSKNKIDRNFTAIKLLINRERTELYSRINDRVDTMMNNGLELEAKKMFVFKHLNALKTVGYKELFDYFEGKIDKKEAILKIKQHTRNYAKRQLTWFKNKTDFKEFNPNDFDKIISYINEIIKIS